METESFKRKGPKAVAPLSVKGIRYEVVKNGRALGFTQTGGVIAAIDEKSGQSLWTLQVYQTHYDEQEEKDVQDVYITQMSLAKDGQSLLIANERKQQFQVNLVDRKITSLE